MPAGKYTPHFNNRGVATYSRNTVTRQTVGEEDSTELSDSLNRASQIAEEQRSYPRAQPVPNYPQGSQAAEQSNDRYASGGGYGYANSDYYNGATIGIGGSPKEGETQGRGFGQTVGTGIGKAVGFIFKPVNYVMNTGVNVLRGVEDTTGARGLGVGYQQNPGRYMGRDESNFGFTGRFETGNVPRGDNTPNGMRDTRPGLFGPGDQVYRQQMSARGGQRGTGNAANSGFFKQGEAFFTEDMPSLSGMKNSVFVKDSGTSALIDGYNEAMKEARRDMDARQQYKVSIGDDGYQTPPAVTDRQQLFQTIFEATMTHANAHPDKWTHSLNTPIAAQEYFKEGWSRAVRDHVPFPIEEKATIDNLGKAYEKASVNDTVAKELKNALQTSNGEKALNYQLENIITGRLTRLTPEQAETHKYLASQEFKEPFAERVRQNYVANTQLWQEGYGVITDTDKQNYTLVPKDSGFALRINDGLEKHDIQIPDDKLEATMGLLALQGAIDKKKDITFEESSKQISKLVDTYGGVEAEEFNNIAQTISDRLNAEVKAKADANEKKKTSDTGEEKNSNLADAKDKVGQAQELVAKTEVRVKSLNEQFVAKNAEIADAAVKVIELKGSNPSATQEIAKLETQIKTLSFNKAEIEYDLKSANTQLSEARDFLKTGTTALADANKAAEEAKKETAAKERAEKEETAKNEKPTPEQIEKTADGIIAALKKDPKYNELESTQKEITVFGIGTGKKINSAEIKQDIIKGTNDYFNGVAGAKSPEQAIQEMTSQLGMAGIKFTSEMKDMVVNTVQDNLGMDVKRLLSSNTTNQQSLNPATDIRAIGGEQSLA